MKAIKMIALTLVVIDAGLSYADNMQLFNQALDYGKQHQFNLNLEQNSNINTYGKQNNFKDAIAYNANTGNAGAKDMHANAVANPNYLYNAGVQEIQHCADAKDIKCTTLNKYGDKDTQAQFQAYSQGIASKYLISVTPDPVDSSCSIIKRKVPVNPTIATCIAGMSVQGNCNSSITISLLTQQCDPAHGGCDKYQADAGCKLVAPFVPGKCQHYVYNANYGGCQVGVYGCDVPSITHTPGCDGSQGRDYVCGTCNMGGDPGDHNGCWNQRCDKFSPPQLAAYACKVFKDDDQCSRYKQ